jgi:hypothetical protein
MSSKNSTSRWEAYCILCNILRRCIDQELPVLPADPPWEQIVQLSSHHLVTPALAWALRDVGDVPDDIREFLEAVLTLNRKRNQEHEEALVLALNIWSTEAIPSVLLKGAASLANNLYPEPAMRILTDIDVLVPVERAEDAMRLLTENGFETIAIEHRDANHHHLAPVRHCATGICVEIHRHTLRADCRAVLPTEMAWREVRECSIAGVPAKCLSPSLQFTHALAHTQMQDCHDEFRSFSVRQMLELAMLARHHGEEMNWDLIVKTFRDAGHYAVLQNSIEFIVRQFGVERPPAIAAPGRDPLRAVRRRLERGSEFPRHMVGDFIRHYFHRIRKRPKIILKLVNPKRLASHFYGNFTRRWRSGRWQ